MASGGKRTSFSKMTQAKLLKLGMLSAIVERRMHFGNRAGNAIDLFGFADLIVVTADKPGVMFLQVCAVSGLSSHKKKMMDPIVRAKIDIVLDAGNRIEMWGWKRYPVTKKNGTTSKVQSWNATRLVIGRDDAGELTFSTIPNFNQIVKEMTAKKRNVRTLPFDISVD